MDRTVVDDLGRVLTAFGVVVERVEDEHSWFLVCL